MQLTVTLGIHPGLLVGTLALAVACGSFCVVDTGVLGLVILRDLEFIDDAA